MPSRFCGDASGCGTGAEVADLTQRVVAAGRAVRASQRHRARARMQVPVSQTTTREPRVLVLTPDFTHPSAGVRTMYRHVDALNRGGIAASVLHHRPGFSCSWFTHDTVVTSTAQTSVEPDDLLVVGELDVDLIASAAEPIRHVVLNQSGHLSWDHSPEQVSAHYLSSRAPVAIIATSRHIAEFSAFAWPHLPVHHVPLSLDTGRFRPGPTPATPTIAWMPRRGSQDAELALQILRQRGLLDGWSTRALSGLTETEVADALRETTIFLSVSSREGFGMPPVEAMASGAYVVGYDACGGAEFMLPEHSRVVAGSDVLGLAQALAEVTAREAATPGWLRERGLDASRFVTTTYRPDAEERAVVQTYGEVLALAR